ncbi:conserved hypothetical protein [Vibrio chagasii]|uniref:hypothetical protein n=1 Tax=Vibrio chagasii TaxID=170679 RepID=UPI00336E3960|nr:conserved hypothetical protein [Vibrio chagasii]CAH6918632.1 conserved hypothetical protein [Vibrio chagasii]CAH6925729.1 conserved hypothetical protein [Vibrio chagasii]CAH7119398.1 conserved hypothetical protein [Vibrio chagasii]CAH7156689.1 conserved hypothetical protein [Vibrio chagasii]
MKINKPGAWISLGLLLTISSIVKITNYSGEKKYIEINSLSAHSLYATDEYSAQRYGVAQKGKLGKMHHCLTQYRSVNDAKRSKGASGPSGSMTVKGATYQLLFSISDGEVTKARLKAYHPDGRPRAISSTVAVNCSIKLLNQ